MNLKNCKVAIEPKDSPETCVRFWCADVEIDDSQLRDIIVNEKGEMVLTIRLKAKPDRTKPPTYCVGYIGDLKVVEQ